MEPDFLEPDFLPAARVAVIGLGLMGGSLALALRERCAIVLGVDPDPEARELALQAKAVARASADPAEVLPEADLVVLATPVRIILSLLRQLPELHPGKAVVLDLGSTKRAISQAMLDLPERFDPLPAHPMCGKERGSFANAAVDLYRGATFALSPLPRTSPRARQLALELVRTVGAVPLWVEAETHDRWAAATSHLPYLLANTLAASTPDDAQPLVGPGFRSSARLAPSPTGMMLDILSTNSDNILEGLGRFRQALDELERALRSGDDQALRRQLTAGADHFEKLV